MAFEKDATVDTITLVKPMGMNGHERKIKREKKEYIIATLKKMMTMDTFFFFVFGPKNDTFLSRLNTTITVVHLFYSSRNVVPW